MLEAKSFVTGDEEYMPGTRIGEAVEKMVDRVAKDTYNNRYVVTVVITRLDDGSEPDPDEPEDEDE